MHSAKNLDFESLARQQLEFWKKTNPKIAKKILELLDNMQTTPFAGLGKPEALNTNFQVYGQGGLIENTGWFIALRMKRLLFYPAGFIMSKGL